MNKDDPIANHPEVKRIVQTCINTPRLSYEEFKQITEGYKGDDLHKYTILMLIGVYQDPSWLFALKVIYARLLGWHSTATQWERMCKQDEETCKVFSDAEFLQLAQRFKPDPLKDVVHPWNKHP